MKHLKKTTATLLAFLLILAPLCGVSFTPAFAAEQPVTATTSVQEGDVFVGGEVSFSVSLSEAVTLRSFALDFSSAYDHDVFEWVDGAWSDALQFSAMTDVNPEYEVAAILNQTAVTAEGEIFTFTLRVKEGVSCNTAASACVAVSGIDGVLTEGCSVLIGHKYSTACDPDCDVCSDTREPDEHEFDNACDTVCNECGATRTAPHVYDNDGDEVCNLCGQARTVEYEVITTVSSGTLNHGDSVTVTVSLSKPRQTKSFALDFLTSYDHAAFEWVSGNWTEEVRALGILTDVNDGSEAIFLATEGTEIPAGEIFRFVLRAKESASCRDPFQILVGATSIPNVTLTGSQIALNHVYSSDCDTRCDICESLRTPLAVHTYANNCDADCDLCGETRLPGDHVYEYACSTVCLECGAVRTAAHTYDNDGDEVCNVCGESRTVARDLITALSADSVAIGETVTVKVSLSQLLGAKAIGLDFENAYDHDVFEWVDGYWSGEISSAAMTEVNPGVAALFLSTEEIYIGSDIFTMILRVKATAECAKSYEICVSGSALHGATPVGAALTVAHGYDNDCDADCNGCGELRVPADHLYDNGCDTDCNVCGETRATSHIYDNEGDEDCNECGAERVVAREMITEIDLDKAALGGEITVTVSLSKPKLTQTFALDLLSAYDHDAFEWVGGTWSDVITSASAMASVDPGEAAVFLSSNAFYVSGEIFTFTLRVKDTAVCESSYEIKTPCTKIENVTLVGDSLTVDHGYDNVCDPDCNGCGAERTVEGHRYDHDGDEECNNCGELRLAFYGTSLSLQHNFAINYKVKVSLLEKYTDFCVEVEMNGEKLLLTEYTNDGTYLSFRYEDIAPQKIGDDIIATLYAKENGTEISTNPYNFGVSQYCERALELFAGDEYASFRTLVVDLLHYSSKAQLYTGYRTDSLVDADLTAAQLAWGTQGDPALQNHFVYDYATIENPTAIWYGAGLILDTAVTLKLKFKAESVEGLSVRIAIENGQTVTVPNEYFTYNSSDGLYYLAVNGLNANQMSRKLELTVVDANGNAVSNTVQYSIESYAYEKQNSTVLGLADLVKAMMNYGNSAKAYGNS